MIWALFLFFIVQNSFATESWMTQAILDDGKRNIYLGVSKPMFSKKEALDDAYQAACLEIVRYNFGFHMEYLEEHNNNDKSVSYNQTSLLYRDDIKLEGLRPLKQKVNFNEGKFVAYRQIAYLKTHALREKQRLNKLKSRKVTLKPKFKERKHEQKKSVKSQFSVEYVYNPLLNIDGENATSIIPIFFELNFSPYVSFGINMRGYMTTMSEKYEIPKDYEFFHFAEKPEVYKKTTIDVGLFFRYYPIVTYRFKAGIGIENVAQEHILYDENDNDKHPIAKKRVKTIMGNLALKYKVRVDRDRSDISLYYDYRSDGETQMSSIGLSFEF